MTNITMHALATALNDDEALTHSMMIEHIETATDRPANADMLELDFLYELIDSHADDTLIDDAFIRAHTAYSDASLEHFARLSALDDSACRCLLYCSSHEQCIIC